MHPIPENESRQFSQCMYNTDVSYKRIKSNVVDYETYASTVSKM